MSEFQRYILDRVKVDEKTGCWLWRLSLDRDGYGEGCFQKHKGRAHRLSHKAFRGTIPDGLHIDHLCRVRHCVNPDHLEAVTCGENIRRGETGSHRHSHCIRGHSLEIHAVARKGRTRRCILCERIRSQAQYRRNRDEILAKARRRYQVKKEI